MVVLSLFDGMSCGQLALKKLGVKVDKYFASEVDKYAIKVALDNFPETVQLGCVTDVKADELPKIDLLIGGSPCQGFSFAGKGLNFDDERSKLFFEYVRLLKECKPTYFLLENVKMKKEHEAIITEYLGVEPVKINSSLLSAQNRIRLYWTNIPNIEQPDDKGILLKDVLENAGIVGRVVGRRLKDGVRKDYDMSIKPEQVFEPRLDNKCGTLTTVGKDNTLLLTEKALAYMDRKVKGGRNHWDFKHHSDVRNDKSACVTANFFKGVPYNVLKDWDCIRKLSTVECERLQTVPDGYTSCVSNTQRYKMLGNGWTVDVVAHIFNNMENERVLLQRL